MNSEAVPAPLISVICNTFNHGAYVSDLMNGLLQQQVNARVELLIHDDASTDNTVSVLKSFEEKMPSNFEFRPVYQQVNQYSKGIKIGATYQYPRVRGKYIAICEGDDFWVDPLKLQKQLDFLESNPDFGLVHGDCDFVYEDGRIEHGKNNELKLVMGPDIEKDALFDALINSSYLIRTATVMFRKACYDRIQEFDSKDKRRFAMGDTPMWLMMSQITRFHYINEVLAAYRISSNSASRPKSLKADLRFRLSMMEMRIWFLNKFSKNVSPEIKTAYNERLINYKILNYEYPEMFPLQEATAWQQLIYRLLKFAPARMFLKTTKPKFLKFYLKNALRKLKKV